MKTVMLAIKPGDEPNQLIHLLHEYVPAPAEVVLVSLVRVNTDREELARLDEATKHVASLATGIEEGGYTTIQDVSVVVPVSEGFQLIQKASQYNVDLAIFGLGSRGRVGKAVMGSDAQRLLLGLTCPVLAVRLT